MGRPKLIGPHTAAETKRKQARERWYRENDELTKKRALEHKHRDQEWFRSIKSQESCADCGHDVYEDLDYHHNDLLQRSQLYLTWWDVMEERGF